jgi:hypothetical protein
MPGSGVVNRLALLALLALLGGCTNTDLLGTCFIVDYYEYEVVNVRGSQVDAYSPSHGAAHLSMTTFHARSVRAAEPCGGR